MKASRDGSRQNSIDDIPWYFHASGNEVIFLSPLFAGAIFSITGLQAKA